VILVLPAFIHRSLSLSSRKTDIIACVMPIVEDRSSESLPPGRLNEFEPKIKSPKDQRNYLVKTGFPASVSTKYSRGG